MEELDSGYASKWLGDLWKNYIYFEMAEWSLYKLDMLRNGWMILGRTGYDVHWVDALCKKWRCFETAE